MYRFVFIDKWFVWNKKHEVLLRTLSLYLFKLKLNDLTDDITRYRMRHLMPWDILNIFFFDNIKWWHWPWSLKILHYIEFFSWLTNIIVIITINSKKISWIDWPYNITYWFTIYLDKIIWKYCNKSSNYFVFIIYLSSSICSECKISIAYYIKYRYCTIF